MKFGQRIGTLIIIIFIALIICVFITDVVSRSYLNEYAQTVQKSASDRIMQVAKYAAELIPLSHLDSYRQESDVKNPQFTKDKQTLIDYANRNDVLFIYYMRLNNGTLEYIIDNDMDLETAVTPGEVTESDGVADAAFEGRTVSTNIGQYAGIWDGLLSAYSPVTDENGNVVAVVGVDISDENIYSIVVHNRNIQIAFIIELVASILVSLLLIFMFRKRAIEYEKASGAKSEFLSRMSHEIRTPLNAIIGMSRMAWESDDLDKSHEYIRNIQDSSKYLLSLINSVLDISKIEAGKMVLESRLTDIPALTAGIKVMVSEQAFEKNISISMDTASDVPKHIMTDSTRLTQILMNLIGNALKFTPDGGKISMSVRLLPENDSGRCHLEFAIQDTGIGIDPSKVKKLFDPFEQADSSTTRNYGGTGLGLAITKMFVEMLDGHITVNSELGKGSTFTFDILADIPSEEQIRDANDHMLASYPASSESESTAAGTDSSDTLFPDCTDKTFIVAEDNEINQIIAKDVIERSGANLEFANNGQEAVDLFTANPARYSAIFMDVQMPIMDGYEATRQIRASGAPGAKDIPIIAMTSNVFAEDYRNSINAGMNAHIGKPFEPEQIALAIRKYVCNEDE